MYRVRPTIIFLLTRRRLACVAIVLLCASSFAGVAQGCECEMESSRHAFRRARAVFIGIVLSSEAAPDLDEETTEGACLRRVRMRVERQFKGAEAREVTIAQCGWPGCYPRDLALGGRYLVYAFGEHLAVMTSACTRVQAVEASGTPGDLARELRSLGSWRWRTLSRLWPWWR
jgi:hypothetical protein